MPAMQSSKRFPKLNSPIALRGVEARNRWVMPAMATHFGSADGEVTDALCNYLATRAQGGFGIVITENMGVDPGGRVMKRMVMADNDRYVEGLSRLSRAIKRHGSIALAQINHGGRQTSSKVTGQELVAPSAIPCPLMREMPRALSLAEIGCLQDAYAAAAVRLEQAGFDGVEIHAAHGYLAAAFLSAYSNKRDDAFGGPLENRMRFLSGIVAGIRQRTGPGFILSVRLSVDEFVPEGITPSEAALIAAALERQGVDMLSLSVGVYESYSRLMMLTGEPEGPWLGRVAEVRDAVEIPVVAVGRIKRPELAEAALAAGQADLLAVGRASITDPDLPLRAARGDSPLVAACTYCNLCLGRSAAPEMICPVNPFVGDEAALAELPRDEPWRLDIIGGGFSALTAAWLAALRGAQVRIVAPAAELGGMQGWRMQVPGQAEYRNATDALIRRARRAGVSFTTPADEAVDEAAGGAMQWRVRRWEPVAPGTGAAATVFDILRGSAPRLPHRLLVVGDDLASTDAALVLADRGHSVTLGSPARDISFDAHPGFRLTNRRLLANRGASVETGMSVADALDRHGFEALVIGRAGQVAEERQDGEGANGPMLMDAYEPGAMARTVYAAKNMLMAMAANTAS
jgi:2,4-dienoyl-CoA reductase-like NADH-dependent reductase (Old Yellow Enzyme family)